MAACLTYLLLLLPFTIFAAAPQSLHQLYVVAPGASEVLSLRGFDIDGDKTTATITSLPASGKLYQLSDIYSKYGYDPKIGTEITSTNTLINDSRMRLLYVRPTPDREVNGEWDRFEYTVNDGTTSSLAGTVVLTGSNKKIIASDFSFDSDSWQVTGNRGGNNVQYEASSRGSLNHYIYATDDTLNMVDNNDADKWYFDAPSKYLGWQGIIYKGSLQFTMSSFSGDFSSSNLNDNLNLVEIHCSKCDTNKGVTLVFPLAATTQGSFNGVTTEFSVSMLESAGWLMDPKNTLSTWTAPSRCQFIEVLSGITSLKILGDFTNWYESISIDNVRYSVAGDSSQIPFCAQGTPDASTCTC